MLSFLDNSKTGIYVGTDVISAANVKWNGKKIESAYVDTVSLLSPSFSSSTSSLYSLDSNIVKNGISILFDKGRLKKGMKVSLCLPDMLARTVVLDIEDLPSKQKDAEEFLLWRLEKLFFNQVKNCRLSFVRLGGENQRNSKVLVSLSSQSLLDSYEDVFYDAGLLPCRTTVASLQIYNLFHDLLLNKTGEGFYLVIDIAESFVFIAVQNGIFEFVRRHHFADNEQGESLLKIAELKTSIAIYFQQSDLKFNNLYWFGTPLGFDIQNAIGIACHQIAFKMLTSLQLDCNISEILSIAATV